MQPGDRIKIYTAEKHLEGTLMPSASEDSIFLKLENGYNLGIDKKKVKKTEILEKKKEKKEAKSKVVKTGKKKKIIVLHTGGTIASRVDYKTGAVTAKFSAEELIAMVPELADIADIETELVANMMSEDMNFKEHVKIIEAVKKHVKDCDGIIIGHGTDTLTYTSSSLAFALENSPIPVILVGSQRSSDRGSSDAAINLLCAARFIVDSGYKGIGICMHNASNDQKCAILSPTKSRKMHTSRRDAFKTINDDPIATIDVNTGKISSIKSFIRPEEDFTVLDKFSSEVGLLKMHPDLDSKLLGFAAENYQALVIEGTGLGHMPTNTKDNLKNYRILKSFIKKGGIVAITSQCIYGRVHPNVYTNLRRLSDIGCIFCEDMLPETAFIKLSWLLGNYDKEKAKELLPINLRGEITERTIYKEDFLR